MSAGADLTDALRGVLKVFDGFFTLLVTSGQEFAVIRDSFACKPMVVAETDDYVAVASEYVALADLPGAESGFDALVERDRLIDIAPIADRARPHPVAARLG